MISIHEQKISNDLLERIMKIETSGRESKLTARSPNTNDGDDSWMKIETAVQKFELTARLSYEK